MSYTPNMSILDIMQQDARRGQGSRGDMLDTWPEDDHPKQKEPWKQITPVNKSRGDNCMLTKSIDALKSITKKLRQYREDTEKALTTRSLYIPPSKVAMDHFDLYRSAQTPVTRRYSALSGPEGVAPLVGDTLENVEQDAMKRTTDTYKSCNVHGIVYGENTGCQFCGVFKSSCCGTCGSDLIKTAGGTYTCGGCGSNRS